jgi:hypothetical protein
MIPRFQNDSKLVFYYTNLLVGQGQFESSFSRINGNDASPGFAIQTIQLVLDRPHGVQGRIQGANGSCISRGQAILDMVQGGVQEHLTCCASRRADIPASRLDTDIV